MSKSRLIAAAGALAGSMFLTSNLVAANLLTNPGFEANDASSGDVAGASGWGSFNFTFTSTSAGGQGGSAQALKAYGPWFQYGGSGVVQGGFAATEGQEWEASAWMMTATADRLSGPNFAVVKIEFLNASSSVIASAESAPINAASAPDTWALYTASGVAPAGTATAQIVLVHVQMNNPPSGGSVVFDNASLDVVIPEPASLGGVALGSLLLLRRRRV